MPVEPERNPIPPLPRPGDLILVIRRLASVGAVRFSYHAEDERMEERDFDTDDIMEALRIGNISGSIRRGKYPGEVICKIAHRPFGAIRWMGVVTVVVRDKYLRIVTTEWEDWQ